MEFLKELGKKIGENQIKKPYVFFIGLVIFLALTLPGIPLLLNNVEPSLEKILPQDITEVKLMNDMRSLFSADMMYVLLYASGPVEDVRDPEVLRYVDSLSNKLRKDDYIKEVMNFPDMIMMVNDGKIPNSNQDIQKLIKLNPRALMFINHDYSFTVIQIRSDTGASSSVIGKVVNNINDDIASLEPMNPGLTYKITGFNAIDRATFQVIMSDFAYITIFSFLFMLIFLFFYFGGSVKKVVGAISVIMISVMITFGITGYLGITITVVTMVAAAMIMALGISYGINITYEYYLLRKKMGKEKALVELNTGIVRALIGSSLTTSAGFLALLFGVLPAMKNLAIVLAIGITITLLVSILILPLIVFKLDSEIKFSKKKRVI